MRVINISIFLTLTFFFGLSSAADLSDRGEAANIRNSYLNEFISNTKIVQSALMGVGERLAAVENDILKYSERAEADRSRASLNTTIAVIASAMLTAIGGLLVQIYVMGKQRAINREQAQSEVSNAYVEWQLKQISELYGPLRALFGQSDAMYRQMNSALVALNPNLFRLSTGNSAQADDLVFEIFKDGSWRRFRTVEHLIDVYGKDYDVEPYFLDVVEVGGRIAELIRCKAGYVQQGDKELIEVMGKYLAHYAVLSRLHERARTGELKEINQADKKATFPIAIKKLVNDGYENLNSEILHWKQFSLSQPLEKLDGTKKHAPHS